MPLAQPTAYLVCDTRGQLAFEAADLFTQDERLRIHDFHHRAHHVGLDRGVLRAQIEQGNGHLRLRPERGQILARSGSGTSRPVFADS